MQPYGHAEGNHHRRPAHFSGAVLKIENHGRRNCNFCGYVIDLAACVPGFDASAPRVDSALRGFT
jgi:hypothetical protein